VGRPIRAQRLAASPNPYEELSVQTEDEDPRFNNILARGLAVLRAFDRQDQLLGNAELAERTGVPKATISRLSFTLAQLGYLSYRPEAGKYELAPGVVALAYPYLVGHVVPPIARPLMHTLANATRSNIGFGIMEGLSVIYLEYEIGEPNPSRRHRVGFRVPLVRSGIGRACYAALPHEEQLAVQAQVREHYPDEAQALCDELEKAAAQVEGRGFCIASGTLNPNINSVAVPFVYGERRKIMAFNSQGPKQIQTAALMARTGVKLLELAEEVRHQIIAAELGAGFARR
jgi:DNA-binding IclR family transcriptional regulator